MLRVRLLVAGALAGIGFAAGSGSALAAAPISPAVGAVTSPTPVFVASVAAGDDPMEIEVSTSSQTTAFAFVSLTALCIPARSGDRVSCSLNAPLKAGTYYWGLLYQRNSHCVTVGSKRTCFPEPHLTTPSRFVVGSQVAPPTNPPPAPPTNPPPAPPTSPPPAPPTSPPAAPGSPPGSNRVLRPTDGGQFSYSAAEQTYASTEAVVHFVTTGLDAPPLNDDNHDGVPDYVQQVGVAADAALSYYTTHEFRPVPADAAGPDGRVDIYIKHFQDPDLYGLTINPAVTPAGTFVLISAHLDPSPKIARGSIDTTVAHELFHVVQFGYLPNGALPQWVAEGSATAMSMLVYPNIDDLTNRDYLDSWLSQPWRPLFDEHSYCDHCYGGSLWWEFLAEGDKGLLPQYFGKLAAMRAASKSFGLGVIALDQAMRARGDGSLAAAFAYFSVALYRYGLDPTPTYRLLANQTRTHRPMTLNGLAANYVPITVAAKATHITVRLLTHSPERPHIALILGGRKGRIVHGASAALRTPAERKEVLAVITSSGPKPINYRIDART